MSAPERAPPIRRFRPDSGEAYADATPDGSVRQPGENTEDGGKTWTVLYDLTCRKRK